MRQNIVFATRSNQLISIDSMSGNLNWKVSLKKGQNIVKALINAEKNIDLIFELDGKKLKTEINSADGKFLSQDLEVNSKASVFLRTEDNKAIAEVGFKDNYSSNFEKEHVFYTVNKTQGIFGYIKTAEGQFEQVWNYLLEPD